MSEHISLFFLWFIYGRTRVWVCWKNIRVLYCAAWWTNNLELSRKKQLSPTYCTIRVLFLEEVLSEYQWESFCSVSTVNSHHISLYLECSIAHLGPKVRAHWGRTFALSLANVSTHRLSSFFLHWLFAIMQLLSPSSAIRTVSELVF